MREIFQSRPHARFGTKSFSRTRGHPFVVVVLSLFLFATGCGNEHDGYEEIGPTGEPVTLTSADDEANGESSNRNGESLPHSDLSNIAGAQFSRTPAIRYVRHLVGDHFYHLVTVNLARPEISIRTTKDSEGYRITSSFAALVGAAVAINGDWFIAQRPRGLARGVGQQWSGSTDLPDHAFIACTNDNMCLIEPERDSVTPLSSAWTSVVGGNDTRLVVNGTAQPFPAHNVYTENTPRTAVGLSADRQTLFLLTVEQGTTGGTRWENVANFLKGRGAWNAIMFDGGGSTTMIVDGGRVNRLKNGTPTEREVANHFAVLVDPNKIPFNGTFADDDNSTHEADIEAIYQAGITQGCAGPPRPRYCPGDPVSRYHMAIFLVRAFNLPLSSTNYFDDDNGHKWEAYVNAIARAGITQGCETRKYCGDRKVTRGEMITFLGRAARWSTSSINYFDDDNNRFYEPWANAAADRGVTNGCGFRRFCGGREVTRGEMAAFLSRTLGLR